MLSTLKKDCWSVYVTKSQELENQIRHIQNFDFDGASSWNVALRSANLGPEGRTFYEHLSALVNKSLKMRESTFPHYDTSPRIPLQDSPYKWAAVEAMELCLALKEEADNYFLHEKTQKTYYTFKDSCLKKLYYAKPELEKHRGMKQILGNILLAIVGLGVGYLAACAVNRVITGNFLFFNETSSANKINKLERSLFEIPKPTLPIQPEDNYWSKQWEIAYSRRWSSQCEANRSSAVAQELLAQYACFTPTWNGGKFGSIGRFFSGNWSRRYGNEVQKIVGRFFSHSCDPDEVKTVEEILTQLKNKIGVDTQLHPNDDLTKIIQVIRENTGIAYEQLPKLAEQKRWI